MNVYVNRTLNLKRINYIGFDMDHTLVRYHTKEFERVAHQLMLEKLVKTKDYPEAILNLPFEFDRAIRGLVIDKTHGNVLKLSRHGAIRLSYHGLNPIDYKLQKKIYKSTYVDLSSPNYDTVDTNFSIAFASLYSQLVELKDSTEYQSLPDYYQIAQDLISVLDEAHRDDSLKSIVRNNIEKYIIKDEDTVRGLERFKKHGKKLFLLTNADYFYTKTLLDYAINPFLKEHKSWEDLFIFVITFAQKPRFFYDNLRFLKINPKDGSMTNISTPISPGIYQGGSASAFTNDLNLDPSEILYIGDHIYGDIVRLKKDCAWRTALVVEELEHEIESAIKTKPIAEKIQKLMEQKIPLEIKVDQLISEQIEKNAKNKEAVEKTLQKISQLDAEIRPLIKEQDKAYNPYWGEIMRTGIEESFFAYQIERYACIYMSKISDFLNVSPRTYFRAFYRKLPHEP
ncbi:MAG: 5'-nucleotidase [Bdellovibrio sp.]|nr:MAG: 5'-nucleotidase [Bdellovibrio sp.]